MVFYGLSADSSGQWDEDLSPPREQVRTLGAKVAGAPESPALIQSTFESTPECMTYFSVHNDVSILKGHASQV